MTFRKSVIVFVKFTGLMLNVCVCACVRACARACVCVCVRARACVSKWTDNTDPGGQTTPIQVGSTDPNRQSHWSKWTDITDPVGQTALIKVDRHH